MPVLRARVREGDVVLLAASHKAFPLLEEVAVAAAKRGAHPIVTVGTERLTRRLYDEVPAKYDSVPDVCVMRKHFDKTRLDGRKIVCGTPKGPSEGQASRTRT
jgi:hypothetical protein